MEEREKIVADLELKFYILYKETVVAYPDLFSKEAIYKEIKQPRKSNSKKTTRRLVAFSIPMFKYANIIGCTPEFLSAQMAAPLIWSVKVVDNTIYYNVKSAYNEPV